MSSSSSDPDLEYTAQPAHQVGSFLDPFGVPIVDKLQNNQQIPPEWSSMDQNAQFQALVNMILSNQIPQPLIHNQDESGSSSQEQTSTQESKCSTFDTQQNQDPSGSKEFAEVLKRKRGRQSHDEQLAQDNGIPATASQIAEMSYREFSNLMNKENLNESQKQLVKKIRRRGMNKMAVRNYRQRKPKQIV